MVKMKEYTTSYAVEKRFEHLFTGHRIDVDRSGRVMLASCHASVNLTDLESGRLLREVRVAPDTSVDSATEEDYVITFGFREDRLVVAYNSGLLKHWRLEFTESEDGKSISSVEPLLLRTWKSMHIGPVASVILDPTQNLVASGGSDSTVKVWDIEHHYCTHNLRQCRGVVNTVAFSPEVTEVTYYLFASGDDYVINVWNLIDSKHMATLEGHQGKVTDLKFVDHQRMVSASRDKLVILWNVGSFAKERTLAIYESIEAIQLVPVSKLPMIHDEDEEKMALITAGESGLLKIWDCHSGAELYAQTSSLLKIKQNVDDVEEDEEERSKESSQYTLIRQLIYHESLQQLVAVSFDKDIIFYHLSDLEQPAKQLVGSNDEVLDIKLLGNEQTHMAVATNSPRIKIFELSTSNCYFLTGHTDIVLALAVFNTNPNLLVSSGKDNSVRVWQFNSDCTSVLCIFHGTGHTHSVTSLATSMPALEPGGKSSSPFFVSGSEDSTIKVWKLGSNATSKTFEENCADDTLPTGLVSRFTASAHDKSVNSVAVAPNNQLMATGSQDRTAKLWTLPHLKLFGVLRGHKRGVWCVRFSPVDQILATCSADTTIKIWSIAQVTCLKTFQGHVSSVLQLCFIDQGVQFLTTASDGNLKIWNLKSNECVDTVDAHQGKVWALEVSNDEQRLVTGGDDSLIVTWKNVTNEVREKEAVLREESVQSEQALQNLLHRRHWFKALKVALRMGHPLRSLNTLREMLLEANGDLNSVIGKLSGELRRDQLLQLLDYAVHWNTNAKHWVSAHVVLRSVLEAIPPEELLQMPDFRVKVEKLLPYDERHCARLARLKQYATFAEFVFDNMKLPDTGDQ